MKEFVSGFAVALTFVGYGPYIWDTIKGKTKPHVYTWFIWSFISAIAFALQMSDQAGSGAFVTLAAALVCFFIFCLSLKYGTKDITRSDTWLFISALVATALWVFAEQALLSIILLSLIDVLAFIPTIRKSWNKPHEETLVSYALNILRFGLAIVALRRYTLITVLYPIAWVVANGLFSVMLFVRRRQSR